MPPRCRRRRHLTGGRRAAVGVHGATKIPIIIFYGDNIPAQRWQIQARTVGVSVWRWQSCGGMRSMAGPVTSRWSICPRWGSGETPLPFSDLNNPQIADLMSLFLKERTGLITAPNTLRCCSASKAFHEAGT